MSYFLLFRASELWAYATDKSNPSFVGRITFLHGGVQVAFESRSAATAVYVTILASKCDHNRAGIMIRRKRLEKETGMWGAPIGAFEAILELLNVYLSDQGGRR